MTEATPFSDGYRLIDGTELNDTLAYPVWAFASTFTAVSGGTVTTSKRVTETITNVTTALTPNAGITMPQALPGMVAIVINATNNNITIFAEKGSSINGVPGNIGIIQYAGFTNMFFSTAVNQYMAIAMPSSPPTASVVTRRQLFNAMLATGIFDQVTQAVQIDSPAWTDYNAAQWLQQSSPLGVLITSLIGAPATAALWALAGSLAP